MIRNPFDINVFNIHYADLGSGAGNTVLAQTAVANARSELVLATFTLATDANIANRVPRIELSNGTTIAPISVSNVSVPASSTYHFTFSQGLTAFGNADIHRYVQPLPSGIYLLETWLHRLVIQNGVAGDTYSAIRFYYKVWTFEQ